MTVLVLDNPELLAKCGNPLLFEDIEKFEDIENAPPRPHRLRFHYGFGKHNLKPEDEVILLEHGRYLAARPNVVVHLHTHTDGFGQDDYNAFLAKLRARTAATLLRSVGVSDNQIRVSSWGRSKPLARPDDHAANRRLELAYLSEGMAKAQ